MNLEFLSDGIVFPSGCNELVVISFLIGDP